MQEEIGPANDVVHPGQLCCVLGPEPYWDSSCALADAPAAVSHPALRVQCRAEHPAPHPLPLLLDNRDQCELFLLDSFPPSHLVQRAAAPGGLFILSCQGLKGQGKMGFPEVSSGPGLPGLSFV